MKLAIKNNKKKGKITLLFGIGHLISIWSKTTYKLNSDCFVALNNSCTALVIFFIFLITESLLGKLSEMRGEPLK